MPVTVKVVTCSSVNQRFHKPSSSLSNLLEQLTELKETVYLLVILKTASQMVLVLKNSPANAINVRDESSIPGWEDPLEEEMATYSSILAWRIPWTDGQRNLVGSDRHDCASTQE